jgi:ubiquinone/menaquinone biosynthesis C-methylase UbiE
MSNDVQMEERKLKEIEHSRKRREVLQGFERIADTHAAAQVKDLENLVKDKEKFDYHFSNMKYYAVTAASEAYKHAWLEKHCTSRSTKILDFACGNGENGVYAATCGADCTGIDISPEGVDNSNKNAKKFGVDDHCRFVVMDGEKMTFADNTFDLGVEYGALHHVDLDVALRELARVLKPGAKMMCVEALRHNPLIHWYRRRTPHLRTEWEVDHILGVESLDLMRKYFSKVDVRFFHLTALALVPLRKTFLFPLLLPIFNAIDRVLLSNQVIGKYGWIMAVELSDPKK